jgi:hypothetical protein
MGAKSKLPVLLSALGTVVLLGGGWVAYSELSARMAAAANAPQGPTLAAAPPPVAFVLGQSVRETANRLDAPYQLAVDRRFRFAKSNLLGQAFDTPAGWPQSFSADDPWSSEHPFPRPPTFDEAYSQLVQISQKSGQPARAVVEDPAVWLSQPRQAIAVIARETADVPTPRDPLAAAQAAISLVHASVDRMGVADQLAGTALAWLVLAERTRGEERTMERAVLALELGYAETAARLGRTAPDGPWKSYLTYDDEALAAQARQAPELWYKRQSVLGRAEERATWEGLSGRQRFGFSGLAASLRSNAFETLGRTSALCAIPLELRIAELAGANVEEPIRKLEATKNVREIPVAILEARGHLITEGALRLGISLETLNDIGRLDLWIERAKERLGSTTGALVFEKYAEALATSCQGGLFAYRFDSQGITPEARTKMGEELFASKRPLFAQLKTWAGLRALSQTNKATTAQIVATAKTLDRLGAPAQEQIFWDVTEHLEFGDSEDIGALQLLAENLDSRPTGLRSAAQNLAALSYDLRYRDFFYEAWAREGAIADPSLAAWWKRHNEAGKPDEEEKESEVPAPPGREAELRSKLDPSIDDWHARQELTRFLRDEGRDAEIPAIIQPWLEAHPNERGFGREWALSVLAEVELRKGNAKQAWARWQPLEESYKLSTIETGTKIALALNDRPKAEELSTRALRRYPTSPHALGLRLRVLWSTGRPEATGDVLRTMKRMPTLADLDPTRDAFVEVYASKTPEEARQAAALFLTSNVTRSFIEVLADRFSHQKHYAHCAAIFEIPSDSPLHQLQNDVWAYKCRKESIGREQALAWLGAKVPPELRAPMVMFAFERRLPELLWALPQPSESQQNDDSDYLWAMRATSQLLMREPLDARVLEHFQKETRMTSYAAIGRYMTGFIDEKTLLTAATNARHANEVAYFLALKAAMDGRPGDAIVWYRASVETHEVRSLEYKLAKSDLYRYMKQGRSLRAIAERAAARNATATKHEASQNAALKAH